MDARLHNFMSNDENASVRIVKRVVKIEKGKKKKNYMFSFLLFVVGLAYVGRKLT